jgi:hypothetical protein
LEKMIKISALPIQRWGGPVEKIQPGDIVWFEPGEKHWHGASPTTAMTHIAIVEKSEAGTAEWLEHVSDVQYQKGDESCALVYKFRRSSIRGERPLSAPN